MAEDNPTKKTYKVDGNGIRVAPAPAPKKAAKKEAAKEDDE